MSVGAFLLTLNFRTNIYMKFFFLQLTSESIVGVGTINGFFGLLGLKANIVGCEPEGVAMPLSRESQRFVMVLLGVCPLKMVLLLLGGKKLLVVVAIDVSVLVGRPLDFARMFIGCDVSRES
jgi:hypothetical protein